MGGRTPYPLLLGSRPFYLVDRFSEFEEFEGPSNALPDVGATLGATLEATFVVAPQVPAAKMANSIDQNREL